MKGKDKCRMLRDIRRRIAEENDIWYITRDCEYKGKCKGTCPRCEAEVRYLESQLEKRRKRGLCVSVAAVAAGVMLGSTGCAAAKGDMDIVDILPSSCEIVPHMCGNELAGEPVPLGGEPLPYEGDVTMPIDESDGMDEQFDGEVAEKPEEPDNIEDSSYDSITGIEDDVVSED